MCGRIINQGFVQAIGSLYSCVEVICVRNGACGYYIVKFDTQMILVVQVDHVQIPCGAQSMMYINYSLKRLVIESGGEEKLGRCVLKMIKYFE